MDWGVMRKRLILSAACAVLGCPASAVADGGPIMPLSQVRAGMDCTADTVIQGTTISSFDAHVINVVEQGGEGARILISVSGPAVTRTGIARGFSGSPVYCPGPGGVPENIGAISEGIGAFGNKEGLVTPIQEMLGEPVTPPSSAPRLALAARPLSGPLMVSGLAPPLLDLLKRAGRRAGRTFDGAPAAPALDFPVAQLVPGASVATSYSTGAIGIGAIGTVTYRDGNTVYAFGHPLDDAGRRSLPLQDAYVYGVINNPNPGSGSSYKLAAPGHTVGTLTSDTPNAVLGRVGNGPRMIPVNVTARDLDTDKTITEDTQVADETDIGNPLGSSMLSTVAPIAVGEAAIDVFDGAPVNQSGTMCLKVQLRERNTLLKFCNRYTGTGGGGDFAGSLPALSMGVTSDATRALGLIDQVQFATLHVARVAASITARRGLDVAAILSAGAPRVVRAGSRVKVQLRVQLYRSSVRTLTFGLWIPKGLHGPQVAILTGGGGSGSGTAALIQELLGPLLGGGAGGRPPASLAALKKAIAAVPGYDGLSVVFAKHQPLHAFRDPKLLITGSAPLAFDVKGSSGKRKASATRK
jgi:hypothetical protein